jgi:uncharacterized protein YvpB
MKPLLVGFILLLILTACQSSQPPAVTSASFHAWPVTLDAPFPTSTSAPAARPEPSPTPTPTLPASSAITDMIAYKQDRPLDCEARAAVDWAAYFGMTISEYEFQFGLPVSDNPDFGFVGTSNSLWGQTPPYSYGVHAEPVAALLRKFGVDALALKGMTLDELKQQIFQGHPVIAWVIGNCVYSEPTEFIDKQGNKTIVAPYEHVIIVVGYTADRIRYFSSGKMYETPEEVFLKSWGVLGYMAIVAGE